MTRASIGRIQRRRQKHPATPNSAATRTARAFVSKFLVSIEGFADDPWLVYAAYLDHCVQTNDVPLRDVLFRKLGALPPFPVIADLELRKRAQARVDAGVNLVRQQALTKRTTEP